MGERLERTCHLAVVEGPGAVASDAADGVRGPNRRYRNGVLLLFRRAGRNRRGHRRGLGRDARPDEFVLVVVVHRGADHLVLRRCECVPHGRGARPSILAPERERAIEDGSHRLGDVRGNTTERWRVPSRSEHQRALRAFVANAVDVSPAQQCERSSSDRPKIAARVDVAAAKRLLRGHEPRRSENFVGAGQRVCAPDDLLTCNAEITNP
jgi:hypothetical protein